jgi:hypothetical protein
MFTLALAANLPIALVPAGNAVPIVTLPVLTAVILPSIDDSEALAVDWFAAVAAPDGNGKLLTLTGTADWSDAITTGLLFALVALPLGFGGV